MFVFIHPRQWFCTVFVSGALCPSCSCPHPRAHTEARTRPSLPWSPPLTPRWFVLQTDKVKLTWRDRFPAYFTNLVSIIFMVSRGGRGGGCGAGRGAAVPPLP